MALHINPAVLLGQIPKVAARSTTRQATRIGPNPWVGEVKRVVPQVAVWGTLMFGFLTWPEVAVKANRAGYWSV